MSARKLWKVTWGADEWRPESKVKAYTIYVDNARRWWRPGWNPLVIVYVDVRDGHGWQVYERIDLADGGAT